MGNFKNIELYLLDMDGTIYIENTQIDGADKFIEKIININKRYVFLTNNSSVNKNNYLLRMKNLGIPCEEQNIFSSGMATGIFLKEERKDKKVYLVGTKALEDELKSYGVRLTNNNPDIVVVGFDRELNYNKLELACKFLADGAEFLATNADLLYPIKNNRFIPDCGSMCNMLTTATNKSPLYIGKPNRYMIDMLAKKHQISHDKIAIIGDRLYTDIASGINANITTICVLTGETSKEMIKKSDYKPDYVFDSIKDLIDLI